MIDSEFKHMQFPVILEKDEDGYFVATCPIFVGCYTQGENIDDALKNIREVIEMCLEEEENKDRARETHIENFAFHAVSL